MKVEMEEAYDEEKNGRRNEMEGKIGDEELNERETRGA